MKRSFALSVLVALLIGGLVVFAYFHGNAIAILNPAGPIALLERNVMWITVFLSAIIVIPLFCMLFVFAWVYRADNPKAKKDHEPNWDHDNYVAEFVWWMVPTVIVIFLAFIAWQSTHALDPFKPLQSKNAPITVQVVALDWKWLFIYPDQGIATVNELEIPKDTPIHFYITADAPMNSFWIPKLSGQIMAMPGMTNQLNLMATSLGTFTGSSANISGEGFAGMTFPVKSVSADEFKSWTAFEKMNAQPLTDEVYAGLVKPSEYVAPQFYALTDGQLYTSIIMKYMMPAMKGMDMGNTQMP